MLQYDACLSVYMYVSICACLQLFDYISCRTVNNQHHQPPVDAVHRVSDVSYLPSHAADAAEDTFSCCLMSPR